MDPDVNETFWSTHGLEETDAPARGEGVSAIDAMATRSNIATVVRSRVGGKRLTIGNLRSNRTRDIGEE
jgi:hypothetical protein